MFTDVTSVLRANYARITLQAAVVAATTLLIPSAHAALVYGVTQQDVLISWDSGSPGTVASGIAISGLQPNETIQGIDFRPNNGQLYAIGSFSRLYTINLTTGAASAVGAGPFSPGRNGANFGFDFNPVVDLARVVSDADQNLRLNPNTGMVVNGMADGNLFYGSGDPNQLNNPNVVDIAYTNNFVGASSTTVYGIDTGLDILVRLGSAGGSPISPNSGQLFTVGSLGINVAEDGGFDILSSDGNTAFAALRLANSSVSHFFRIDLTTGLATDLGEIAGGVNIRAMALAPIPNPGSLTLMVLGALIAVPRRRRYERAG